MKLNINLPRKHFTSSLKQILSPTPSSLHTQLALFCLQLWRNNYLQISFSIFLHPSVAANTFVISKKSGEVRPKLTSRTNVCWHMVSVGHTHSMFFLIKLHSRNNLCVTCKWKIVFYINLLYQRLRTVLSNSSVYCSLKYVQLFVTVAFLVSDLVLIEFAIYPPFIPFIWCLLIRLSLSTFMFNLLYSLFFKDWR